jgi:uncharacterized protein YukJ
MPHSRFRKATSESTYGVLVGRIADGQENSGGRSPHYELLVDVSGTPYRVAVNVESVDGSDVLAYFDDSYSQDTKLGLSALASGPPGFTALATGPMGQGLDYVRDNLCPLDKFSPIPPDGSGTTLAAVLDSQVARAKQDKDAVVIAVGDEFDDNQTTEKVHFTTGRGVHDIHMMQGNSGHFARDNRINGDGALFIRFSGGDTVALFVRFSTQSTNTDNDGNPFED